jgi:hypothetical protein
MARTHFRITENLNFAKKVGRRPCFTSKCRPDFSENCSDVEDSGHGPEPILFLLRKPRRISIL